MKKKIYLITMLILAVFLIGACGKKEKTPVAQSPKELLEKVWEKYADSEKFMAFGGDYSSENAVTGGPGNFSVSDGAALKDALGFPEAEAGKIDAAASLYHMNANTFTGGAYHLKSEKDAKALCDGLRENIQSREWICGFPDKLLIAEAGDYVVSAFGEEELMNTFKAKLTEAYPDFKVVYEEAIR